MFFLLPHFLVFSDVVKEGEWLHYFTGDEVDLSIGGQVAGSEANNCGMLIPMWNGWKVELPMNLREVSHSAHVESA